MAFASQADLVQVKGLVDVIQNDVGVVKGIVGQLGADMQTTKVDISNVTQQQITAMAKFESDTAKAVIKTR